MDGHDWPKRDSPSANRDAVEKIKGTLQVPTLITVVSALFYTPDLA